MEPLPPEAFLEPYPVPIRELAERLRDLVRRAFPDVIERVRPGWRLIGYELRGAKRPVYFAYVAPEPMHVHLGFEHGWAMRDPGGHLHGAGITKQVRWLTWQPGDRIDAAVAAELLREAADVARMTRGERVLRAAGAED